MGGKIQKNNKIAKAKITLVVIGILLSISSIILSLIYVFASSQDKLSSGISINYISQNVAADVTCKYWDGGVSKTSVGSNTLFGSSDQASYALNGEDLTALNNMVVFEYAFKNLSYDTAFTITLEESPRLKASTVPANYVNVNENYYVSAKEVSIADFGLMDLSNSLNIQPVMQQRVISGVNQNDTVYIYVVVSVDDVAEIESTNYSGNMRWSLDYVNPSDIVDVNLAVNNGLTVNFTKIQAVKQTNKVLNMPAIFDIGLNTVDTEDDHDCCYAGVYDIDGNPCISSDGSPLKTYDDETMLFARYEHLSYHDYVYVYDSVNDEYDCICTRCNHELTSPISTGLAITDNVVTGIGTCTDSVIVVPYGVTGIGSNAFKNNTSISEVIIPQTVTSIGFSAFNGCTSLERVDMTDSVETIDQNAFRYCSNLEICNLSNNLTSIGSYAFDGCSSLTDLVLTDSLVSIKNYAFRGCSSLTVVTIPSSITDTGGKYMFQNCTGLTNVTISIPVVKERMFDGCSNLKNVTFTDSVTTINTYAFSGCSSLTKISVPSSVTTLDSYIFANCTSLSEVTTTWLGQRMFSGCTSLTKVTIREGATSIKMYAFKDNTALTEVVIPNTVTEIQGNAFYGCTSLSNVTIPNGVTTILSSAFTNCTSLTILTIPNSVAKIWGNAFSGCSSLKIVLYLNDNFSPSTNAFSGIGGLYIYAATKPNWDNNVGLSDSVIYTYRETQPEPGYYWHFVDGEPTLWYPYWQNSGGSIE